MEKITSSDILCNGTRLSTAHAFAIIADARKYKFDSESLDEVMTLIRETLEDCTAVIDAFGGDAWEESYNDAVGYYGSHLMVYQGDFYLVYYYIAPNGEVVYADDLDELKAWAELEEEEE